MVYTFLKFGASVFTSKKCFDVFLVLIKGWFLLSAYNVNVVNNYKANFYQKLGIRNFVSK